MIKDVFCWVVGAIILIMLTIKELFLGDNVPSGVVTLLVGIASTLFGFGIRGFFPKSEVTNDGDKNNPAKNS